MDGQDRKLPVPRPEDVDGEAKQEKQKKVGYGHPPVDRQFKPGRSGNPAGRPKGSRNRTPAQDVERMRNLVLEEAYREISVIDGGQAKTMTILKASLRSLGTKAAKGHIRSQELLHRSVEAAEKQRSENLITFLRGAINYKKEAYEEIARRKAAGEDLEGIYPHPDEIYIDAVAGTVDFVGPSSSEEKEAWDAIDSLLLLEDKLSREFEELAPQLEYKQPSKKTEKLRGRLDQLLKMKNVVAAAIAKIEPISPLNKVRRLRRLAAMAREGGR